MSKYLIGIDVGTSGTKSVLFDVAGRVICSATEEYPMAQPKNGWAEQNPEDWWDAAVKTVISVTEKIDKNDIVGIGLTGQMHSLVILDENNKVIRPAILWCDGRTNDECREIEAAVGRERLIELTANPALPGFTAPKLLWIRNNEPENYVRIRHALIAKDYIRFKLTGEYCTDMSDASGTSLLNVTKRCWSDEVIDALGIDKAILPKLLESVEVSGRTTAEAAKLLGIPEGTPVAAGAGDNAASALGCGICNDGDCFTTIGTSGVVFVHTKQPRIDPRGRIHTFCAAVPGEWHVMGVTLAAGQSLNWFRRNFAETVSYKELDAGCENLPIGSDRLIYLPYIMGERTPILNSDARGVFFGLSGIHTKFHLARAVMEGVSFSLLDCLSVIEENGISVGDVALCGGGGKSVLWQKMIADVFEKRINTMASEEGPALGAAILAGCAAGIYKNVNEGCQIATSIAKNTDPCQENSEVYKRFYSLYRDLYPTLCGSFEVLRGL